MREYVYVWACVSVLSCAGMRGCVCVDIARMPLASTITAEIQTVCVCVCVHVCVWCVCVSVFVCVLTCVCVCACILPAKQGTKATFLRDGKDSRWEFRCPTYPVQSDFPTPSIHPAALPQPVHVCCVCVCVCVRECECHQVQSDCPTPSIHSAALPQPVRACVLVCRLIDCVYIVCIYCVYILHKCCLCLCVTFHISMCLS